MLLLNSPLPSLAPLSSILSSSLFASYDINDYMLERYRLDPAACHECIIPLFWRTLLTLYIPYHWFSVQWIIYIEIQKKLLNITLLAA